MTDEWVETTLGDVGEFINGYPFKPAELSGSQLPVIRIKQLLDPSAETDFTDVSVPDKVRLSDGDLVFSWSGSLASRIWDRGPAALNQHLFRVIERPGVDRGWLHLALDHAVDDLMEKSHGTTMKHVTKGVLQSHSVLLPPLPVQRRIVDLMAHLDNHIANLRAERDGLEEALTIACLEFTAERQGVPLSPISDVAEILDRLRVPISEKVRAGRPGNVPYFGANGQVGWIDEAIFDEPLVLLAEDGGPVAEWRTRPQAYAVDGPCWVNNHAHVLRATAVPRDWLYFSLRHRDLTALAPVGTRSKLTQASLKEIQISLPLDLEEKSEQLRSMEDSVSALEGEIAACRSLRSTVLGAVLSRELAIPEAYDALLPEVA